MNQTIATNLLRDQAYIGGQWEPAASKRTFDVLNPATGERIGSVPDMARTDVRRAIHAADQAWPGYRGITAKDRSALMKNWYALVMDHQEELAVLMASESGKVITESMGEIAYGAAVVSGLA